MSLYNMMMGFNPACVVILPMLGRKEDEYPRFRDCFITDEGNIAIYTRVGGGNRKCGYGEEELYNDENFITTYDDEYDNTYGTYEFKVPEKWKADFNLIINGMYCEVSQEYVDYVKEFYPKLAEKGVIDKVFERETTI
jgi:hypothetical protein